MSEVLSTDSGGECAQVRARMEGRIKAVVDRIPVGKAEVKALFGKGKFIVAGCIVTEGRMEKGGVVEVVRGRKRVVYEGPLTSLRRVKDNVAIVEEGTECGVACGVRFWSRLHTGCLVCWSCALGTSMYWHATAIYWHKSSILQVKKVLACCRCALHCTSVPWPCSLYMSLVLVMSCSDKVAAQSSTRASGQWIGITSTLGHSHTDDVCNVQAFYEWAEGDKIECFKLQERTLTLEEAKADSAVDFEAAMAQFAEEMEASNAEAKEAAAH